MPIRHFDLHVPVCEDGRTTFSEIADILDHLATLYAWHPDAYGFLLTRALEARNIDGVYEHESAPVLDLEEVRAHWRAFPQGCPARPCEVCAARRKGTNV